MKIFGNKPQPPSDTHSPAPDRTHQTSRGGTDTNALSELSQKHRKRNPAKSLAKAAGTSLRANLSSLAKLMNRPGKGHADAQPPLPQTADTPPSASLEKMWHAQGDHGWGMAILQTLEARALEHKTAPTEYGDTPLMSAMIRGDDHGAAALIKMGAEVNTQDDEGNTPLHLAAMNGHLQLIHALLQAGARPGSTNQLGQTPLFEAKTLDAAEKLLEAGVPIDHVDNEGHTALMHAIECHETDIAMLLLSNNARCDQVTARGDSIMHLAASQHKVSLLQALIDKGLPLNQVNDRGQTPLFGARRLPILEAMLNAGAVTCIDQRDKDDHSVLDLCIKRRDRDAIRMLLQHGAEVDANTMGDATLNDVIANEPDLLDKAIGNGFDIHGKNLLEQNILFSASSKVAVDALIARQLPIDAVDARGRTALLDASLQPKPNMEVMVALLSHGADVNIKDKLGQSFRQRVAMRLGLSTELVPTQAPQVKALLTNMTTLEDLYAHNIDWNRVHASDHASTRSDKALPLKAFAEPEPVKASAARALAQPAIEVGSDKQAKINALPSGRKINLLEPGTARLDFLGSQELESMVATLGYVVSQDRQANIFTIRQCLQTFLQILKAKTLPNDPELLSKHGLLSHLTDTEKDDLSTAMSQAHMLLSADTQTSVNAPLNLHVFFGGSESLKDTKQNLRNAVGQLGHVDRAVKRLSELFAKMTKAQPFELGTVSGLSMGGASAQMFRAAIESEVQLTHVPTSILLDPQLPNNKQAAHALAGGRYGIDFTQPRGLAITLDYAAAPHKGLMGIMKGPGRYHYPGLVQLKLPLQEGDGPDRGRPHPDGPLWGYHAALDLYVAALERFLKTASTEESPLPTKPDAGPLRLENTLSSAFRAGERRLDKIDE